MKKHTTLLMGLLLLSIAGMTQNQAFEQLGFLLGQWEGTGQGFGNNQSTITSSFELVLNDQYIEVINDYRFEPTSQNPAGEHHIDQGMISFDKGRGVLVFRQFNIEGYINQYVLVDSLSTDRLLVFETEHIENFVPGGTARWTIEKLSEDEVETNFYVAFPGREPSCFGTNTLNRKKP